MPAVAQDKPADGWSRWIPMRGHFQFQFRTELVEPTVMKVHMRVRPDVAKIAAEPTYHSERYFLEYSQAIEAKYTGGRGALTTSKPRRIVFPANAPESCVFAEEDLYAINEPAGKSVRLYMDPAVSPLPLLSVDGDVTAGINNVVGWETNIGPGDVVRFSGVDRASFVPAC